MTLRMAAVAANFDRDLEGDFARVATLIEDARDAGVRLLALPEGALGGYLLSLDGTAEPPPAFDVDGPEIKRLAALAGDLVVTAGYAEADDGLIYNSAVCVTGDGVLGHHRKVPVGRLGLMICYDKAFPEAARTLALDGAQLIVCLSAWPGARTNPEPDLAKDRWKRRFDLFDRARALENQVVWLSSNQSGTFGSLRFVASAKVVDPGGEILADTGVTEGMAIADLDVELVLDLARRSMGHLRDRRPETYELAWA